MAGAAEGNVSGGSARCLSPLAWMATSTALTSSGVWLYRLDRVMRTSEPAMLLWTTIRMVWLLKAGPPVVMLGDQALTRVPLP